MQKISSEATAFAKKTIPLLVGGALGIPCVLVYVLAQQDAEFRDLGQYLYPLFSVLAVADYLVLKRVFSKFMDEVFLDGKFLVIKNDGYNERIALTNVIELVHTQKNSRPSGSVALRLHKACRFGEKIWFFSSKEFGAVKAAIFAQISQKQA